MQEEGISEERRTSAVAPGPGPRSAGGIIVEMFRLYGRYIVAMVAISAVVTVPLIAAGLAAFGPDFMGLLLGGAAEQPMPTLSGGASLGLAAYAALYTLGLLAVSGALAQAGAQGLVAGPVSIGHAYAAVLRRLLSMLVASIMVGLAAGIPIGLGGLIAAGGGVGKYLLAIPAIIVGVYLAVRLMFAPLIALFQQASPVTAIVCCWNLVSRSWLRTFGLLFIVSLVLGVIQMPVLWLVATIPGIDAFLFALVLTPLTTLGNLLIYLDLRTRKDGYMTEHLMAELDGLAADA